MLWFDVAYWTEQYIEITSVFTPYILTDDEALNKGKTKRIVALAVIKWQYVKCLNNRNFLILKAILFRRRKQNIIDVLA